MSPELVAILAEIAAANVRVLGMHAENAHWLSTGGCPAYREDHFQAEANHLDYLATKARSTQ